MNTALREHLTCPICYTLFQDPIVLSKCQHTFCGSCINSALSFKEVCPVCRAPVKVNQDLSNNRFIANIINDNKMFLTPDPNEKNVNGQQNQTTTTAILRLSITERYAPKWQSRQGIREIVQNWYDGVNEQVAESGNNSINAKGVSGLGLLDDIDDDVAMVRRMQVTKTTLQDVTRYTATYADKEYGVVEYNHSSEILTLTNQNVSLPRKILLLGSSNKVGKDYLVGQFGEGLKIGILALVRENRGVIMNTNNESWTFGLQHDAQYGEKVLSVTVERNNLGIKEQINENNNHTTTTVHGVTLDQWNLFATDFLFLTPPKESCETINGTLLLDDTHKHKLFVKGFWICDLKDAGLMFGVNLNQMELDRDRRAVVQKHDIDNKVADIWSKAITIRKDLVPIFFDLLMMNDEMVNKAQWYINDLGVTLLADFFIRSQGENAQPVCNTNKDDVLLVETVLHKKAVLCPEPLYNILVKSQNLRPIEEELSSYASKANKKVAKESLTTEEKATLQHVMGIIHTIIDPTLFTESSIQLFENNFGTNGTMADFGQYRNGFINISRKALDPKAVHESFNRCSSFAKGLNSNGEKCRCVETYLLLIIISLRAESNTTNYQMRQGMEKVMTERLMEKMLVMLLAGK